MLNPNMCVNEEITKITNVFINREIFYDKAGMWQIVSAKKAF